MLSASKGALLQLGRAGLSRAVGRRALAVVAAGPGGKGKGLSASKQSAATSLQYEQAPHPTAVPRQEGVKDGAWSALDQSLVKAAKEEAVIAAKAAKPAAGRADEGPVSLLGLSLEELQAFAVADGQPLFRGKQLHDHLYGAKRAKTLDDLTAIPKAWRESLAERGVTVGRSTVHTVAQASDGTAKLLLRLSDGRVVETVGIPMEDESKGRLTACVSSQVGCPMRCTFCATGKGGFARNLKPHEIVDQILSLEEHFNQRVSNIVFMGMGEPCLNLPSVLAAHRCLNQDVGISSRAITISTVGVPQSLRRLAEHKLQSTLAVSLHAPTQELRERLIPSAKAYPFDALLQDCRAYFEATGRRVTFEYTLLKGINDSVADARTLAAVLKKYRLNSHVNLIPYNFVDDSEYEAPSKAAVKAFEKTLIDGGCGASVRITRGLEAAAACGQLRNRFQSKASEPAPEPAAAGGMWGTGAQEQQQQQQGAAGEERAVATAAA